MTANSVDGGGMRRTGLYDPAYEHDGCGIGFVAHIKGERSPEIVRNALQLLENLAHRSAVGADAESGDGAGMLVQIPHAFLWRACRSLGIGLPEAGSYGVGMLFLPPNEADRAKAEVVIERIAAERGCRVLGWRDVPVNEAHVGALARATRPAIRQLFLAPLGVDRDVGDASALERTLYVIRKCIERASGEAFGAQEATAYVASLSSRTVVYKGMLRPGQLRGFYPDLVESDFASALALVHSRFSTNTFPSWPLAHPYRYVCHNGEINTLRGNLTWMRVREACMQSEHFGDALAEILPVVSEGQSDSACFDNVLELLVQSGRPLAHAMMMLIPEAWEGDDDMPSERRAFYDFHSSLIEPWDGPAAMAFTDGRHIGAVLDRNGLRPARYVVTNDDILVLASEAGALPFPTDKIRAKGRLQPGRMLLVNTTQGRILDDMELKEEVTSRRPYRRWLSEQRITLPDLAPAIEPPAETSIALVRQQRAFGYTAEELRMVLAPMAANGEEAVGSMGNDAPLAVLSDQPQLLFAYFRHMFAQVTNPAIDPIRERLVMSLGMNLGPQANLLDETPQHARQLRLEHPVLSESGMRGLRAVSDASLRVATLSTLWVTRTGPHALHGTVDTLCCQAADAVRSGCNILVLSDAGVDTKHAAIPSLLAVAAVHHHLIRERLRARVSVVVETAEAREVSHVALLFAYGASAVHPYLALETVAQMACRGELGAVPDRSTARANYVKAVEKGLLKILSKMGISTLQSFCGAQICEAIGLDRALVEHHFTGTSSPIGGVGLGTIATDTLRRHAAAFDEQSSLLDFGGEYHYRVQGEHHAWNPATIATLQHATRANVPDKYREFSRLANGEAVARRTLRGLVEFAECNPRPLDEVEPASQIVKRFVTGAMSFGSISREAHETLAIAMNRLGGRSNTGEGGEERTRFGTERNSAIKQVASARFGVTTEYLVSAAELQIKIAQGAKPGEGGQLPGYKVDEVIARTRHSTPGVTLISPPPHHDIYSIEDLAQLIHDLKCVNPRATVSVKLVAESGVGTVAAGVAKAGADLITISGDSGGTGASPLSSIKRAGIPWELGLAEVQQTLVLKALRGRVRLQTDGQLKTGRDVVVAALLGADEFGFATAPLVVAGCVMMRKCHLNTCPVGIATQDPELRAKFTGRPEDLINYFFLVAEEVREVMARLGFRAMDDMIGRSDVLRPVAARGTDRSGTLDLYALLHTVEPDARAGDHVARHHTSSQPPIAVSSLERALIELAEPALVHGEAVSATLPIRTADRAVGAMLSGEIARRYGNTGLPDESIVFRFTGSAGQSFGAFAARGLSLEVEGEANDYVGKGLSGARIVVRAPRDALFLPDETVIVGNTVLYGATSGEAYFGGVAGERFAVRNSGAQAVVEGVGNHGCEYMTGGVVVVLGRTGRNFAAGMSGGVAFVLDEARSFERLCNRELVELGPVANAADRECLRMLIERHARFTGSPRARHVLAHWDQMLRHFVLVMPVEYRKALARTRQAETRLAEEGARHG